MAKTFRCRRFSERQSTRGALKSPLVEEMTPLEILLVDYSADDLLLHQRALTQCRIVNKVTTMRCAREAIEYLRAGRTTAPPKRFLVFMDLMMSPPDGLELLRAIGEENLGDDSILIMLSGLNNAKLLHEGYQLGANSFLEKPLESDHIMDLLNSLRRVISVSQVESGLRLQWVGT